MATPRRLPFEVRLKFGQLTRVLRNFTENPNEANVDETYLTEYRPCLLEFVSISGAAPPDARLYIDGFDALVDEGSVLEVDDDRVYMPCGKQIAIQSSDDDPQANPSKGDSPYPWIPGNYRVEVQWDGRRYYTILNVCPKNLSWDQLRLMRQELEQYVVGLTLDIVRRNQGIGHSDMVTALPVRFYQYQLLHKNLSMIEAALRDIARKPKQEVRRTYSIQAVSKNLRRDHKSYRWSHSHQGLARNCGQTDSRARVALVPASVVTYDLPENRWVRRIVEDLLDITDDIATAIRSLPNSTDCRLEHAKSETQRLLRDILHIQSRLRGVLSEPVFRSVSLDRGALPYTPAMQRDGRYRTLYKFWRDLRNHSRVRVDAAFEYQWKRTDVLWEYWTLVRTIQALRQLGFEPVSGWIFGQDWKFPERVLIPVIPEGTRIVMTRDNEQIAIHYAERIAHSREVARQMGSLLYVEGVHNWPDLRLDYLRDGSYQYSVVVEAKYRPLRYIWDENQASNRQLWTKIMNQLQAYRSVSRLDNSLVRAVKEVIVVYPRGDDKPPVYEAWDHIVLIRLTPGESDNHYVEHFAQHWGRTP